MSEGPQTRRWPGQHVLSLDFRSLAVFRILFGIILLFDCLIRWWDAIPHYTDLGVLPRQTLLESGWPSSFWSVHMISGEPAAIHLLFLFQTSAAVALLLGYRTRLATLVSWVLMVSIHNRNPWLLNGGDTYARVILFWMLFLPWGQLWSWDARRGDTDLRWWMGKLTDDGKGVQSLAALAVLMQVCLLYWFAALPKVHPCWVGDYSAIEISLRLDHLIKPFSLWFREAFAPYLAFLTWATLEWEVWGPFLLLFPFDRGQVRILALAVFAAMHVGFELCFEIGLFPAYCTIVLAVLLPSWWWDRPLKLLTSKLPDRTSEPVPSTRTKGIASQALYGFLMVYVCCWNFGNEQFKPALWLPDSTDFIGYTLRLDQRWNMFSPNPPYQDGWWVIKGVRQSGKELNLIEPSEPISFDKPDNIAGSYLTQRRRRWMMELRSNESELLMTSTCRHLCWKLNGTKRSLHNVQKVELYYVLEMTYADGSEGEPVQHKIFEHDELPETGESRYRTVPKVRYRQ